MKTKKQYSRKAAFLVCEEINDGASCSCRRRGAKIPCDYIAGLFRSFDGDASIAIEFERLRRSNSLSPQTLARLLNREPVNPEQQIVGDKE